MNFFTIGHARRSADEFVRLLKSQDISLLADVRSVPRSRANPLYNIDTLPEILKEFQIEYKHIPELGGFRSKSGVPNDVNGFWEHPSFHKYADYAISDTFRSGLLELRRLGESKNLAIMCAEAVWWKCHRRIISDHLLAANEKVFHILDFDNVRPARLTPAAHITAAGEVTYPSQYD